MSNEETITYHAVFAYSGSCRREFFGKDFTITKYENIDSVIKDYLHGQNKGEAKSDRIRFISKTKI